MRYYSNYHTNEWIQSKIEEHLEDVLINYPKERIVGIFYQGSGNYGLDYEDSDVDTKCILIPSIEDLHDLQQESYCSVRKNDEHTDMKDVRLMFDLFRKQNINFMEILFTPFYWINPMYEDLWKEVLELRDTLTECNKPSLLKSLKGVAGEKYHAMEHRYPSRAAWVDKFGYDPKQLHHLIRIEEFLRRWLNGASFKDCLISQQPDCLIEMKRGWASLAEARKFGTDCIHNIDTWYKEYYDKFVEESSWTSSEFATASSKLHSISNRMITRYLEDRYSR